MKLALIALGQAGGKVVDAFIEYETRTQTNFIVSAHAINTARPDLHALEHVPTANRILIGQSRVKGHGVGGDNELAATITTEEKEAIMGELDSIPVHEIDAFLLVAGLGGGTGSGATPVLAHHLNQLYTEPVYGLGILPARDEGGLYALNATRSLQTCVAETDAMLLFDNDAWRSTGESVAEGYETMNKELTRRFGVLFSAGETETTDTAVAESVVDSSEIINTLSGGVATVGYATSELDQQDDGLLSRLRGGASSSSDETTATNRITTLVRKATLSRLTVPCEIDQIERALVIVSGPPDALSRKGIERGRQWLEQETGCLEIRGGDHPLPNEDKVAVTVILAGIHDVPRIEALKTTAVDAQEAQAANKSTQESATQDLVENDQLDTLF